MFGENDGGFDKQAREETPRLDPQLSSPPFGVVDPPVTNKIPTW